MALATAADLEAILIQRELARRHLLDFVKYRFEAEKRPLVVGWYLEYLCEILEAVTDGELRRVIVNFPPRMLKSELVSQSWQAWMIGRDNGPMSSVVSASYSGSLAARDSAKTRDIVTSDWYQALFPGIELAKEHEVEWYTTQGASRVAAGSGGTITGKGGEILIGDDLLKPQDANSQVIREKINTWTGETFWSRMNNKRTGKVVIVAQRLHEEDPCGYLLKRDNPVMPWMHINLPNEFTKRKIYSYGKFFHETNSGEFLCEELAGQDEADELRLRLGPNYEGQYQQNPVKMKGDFLRTDWLVDYERDPMDLRNESLEHVYMGGDLAVTEKQKDKDDPDYSSLSVVGADHLTSYFILDVWRDQCHTGDLVEQIIRMHRKWRPTVLWLERGGILNSLMPLLRKRMHDLSYYFRIEEADTNRDKMVRAGPLQGVAALGDLHIPINAPWRPAFLNEWASFPRGSHDDQIDGLAHIFRNIERIRANKQEPVLAPIGDEIAGPEVLAMAHEMTKKQPKRRRRR